MKVQALNTRIATPLFTTEQVCRAFNLEDPAHVATQLARFERHGYLIRLKRGLYQFAEKEIDEFVLATWL